MASSLGNPRDPTTRAPDQPIAPADHDAAPAASRADMGSWAPGPRITHAELARQLPRFGYPPEVIEEITAQLDDPIDIERDS